jgi:ABC-type multidrug transport system fused ATPase/permease subunit
MVGEFAFLYLQYYLTMLVAQSSLADCASTCRRTCSAAGALLRPQSGRPAGDPAHHDVDVINEMFAAGALTILMDVVTLLGIVGIMLAIDFRLALMTLLVCPALVLAINFFRLRSRQSYRAIRDRIARLNAYLQEALAGMAVIQVFAREARSFERFDRLNDAHREANHYANIYEASLFSMIEAISSMSFAIIVWYGGGQILASTLAFGTLVAFIEYIQKFFVPIRDFSTKYAVMQSAMSSARACVRVLDTPLAIESPEVPTRPPRCAGGSSSSTCGSPTTARTGCSATSPSRSSRGSTLRSSDRPDRARPR